MDQIQMANTLINAVHLLEEPGHEKDWATPQLFLDALYTFGPVRLDPCSNRHSIVESEERWTINKKYLPDGSKEPKKPEDTFTTPWPKDGLIFCNPPYGKESDVFLEKMAQEGKEGAEIIALVPARVDTARWHAHAEKADAILLWKGRISFISPVTGEPQSGTKFPSAVLYWGPQVGRFIEVFGDYGSIRLRAQKSKKEK